MLLKFSKIIKRILGFFGIYLSKYLSDSDMDIFFKHVRSSYRKTPLIRIGKDDGGYLLPRLLIQDIDVCFSPGVGDSWDFESHLASTFGIKSHMIDASVPPPNFNSHLLNFESFFLSNYNDYNHTTIDSWVAKCMENDPDKRLLLQMDIEGAEYEVLSDSSIDTLCLFDIIVIEFHQFNVLFTRDSGMLYRSVFYKILSEFWIVHIHPNNACAPININHTLIPPLIEVTFVRRDLLSLDEGEIDIPHPLDRDNVPNNKSIQLSRIFTGG